ncbi:hypothetical protein Q9L58_004255 [Maublancomyces gigas]|uniref:Uncharacterized protein n=1 Tax=Discina gigas TaxID=1032678 RepID=A0ABR3GLH0_9PEZI
MSNCRPPALRRGEQAPHHPSVKAVVATPNTDPAHKPRPKRRRKKKKQSYADRDIAPVTDTSRASQQGEPVDVSCAVSECDSGIALDDDFVVAAGDFVIEMMDPEDPRITLPVPERNFAVTTPRDPGHERLSWTVCYDDDCPIHLSDKHGSGWFPSGRV